MITTRRRPGIKRPVLTALSPQPAFPVLRCVAGVLEYQRISLPFDLVMGRLDAWPAVATEARHDAAQHSDLSGL